MIEMLKAEGQREAESTMALKFLYSLREYRKRIHMCAEKDLVTFQVFDFVVVTGDQNTEFQ